MLYLLQCPYDSVTRGSFGWSKTTPARSFATFGPNFLKIVDAAQWAEIPKTWSQVPKKSFYLGIFYLWNIRIAPHVYISEVLTNVDV
jgi:hypothetical protein